MHVRGVSRIAATGIVLALACDAAAAGPSRIALRPVLLELPGPPAAIVAADLDEDGRKDLLVVTAVTSWGQVSTERIDNAVLVTEVVPALFDERQARAWLAGERGEYRPLPPLALDRSVHHVEAGPAGFPAVALVDGGLGVFRVKTIDGAARLVLDRVFSAPGALDGTDAFLSGLRLVEDVTGDGRSDLLYPAAAGWAVYPSDANALAPSPVALVRFPSSAVVSFSGTLRRFDRPRVEDVDGDGHLDLFVASPSIEVARGLGEGRMSSVMALTPGCTGLGAPVRPGDRERGAPEPPTLSHFGDIDGDGLAEIVVRQEVDTDRGELKKTREPRSVYRFHRLSSDLSIAPTPYLEVEIPGYASSGDVTGDEPDFKDLDGDGRKDFVALTLDFSVLQAIRVLATKRISVGVDFTVWAQGDDGRFRKVPNRGLDEKLKFDLDDLRVGRMAQFAGDFDGDGRVDFVHLGRGATVTVHRGRPGGVYAEDPDLAVELREEPQDLALVQVRDFDGDDRSDLAITRVGESTEEGASAPASVELLLSGGVP